MTVDGLAAFVLGLVAIGVGSAVAKRRVVAEYGRLDAETRAQAEEDGAVPGWATALVLLGYLGVVLGLVLVVVGLIRG